MFSGFDNVRKRKRNFKFLSFSVISEGLKLSVPVISIHGGVLKKLLNRLLRQDNAISDSQTFGISYST